MTQARDAAWRQLEPTLTGPGVVLRALQHGDAEALVAAAADGELWKLAVTVVPGPDTVGAYIGKALDWRAAGTAMPFVIVLRESGRVVGSSRYWKLDAENRRLEIGHTWLAASVQRTAANTEAKLLMLAHAFEAMGAIRVQFTTDERNARSRAAILRIGAREEGVIRHERIMPDGYKRNSVRYSIIDDEWPEVKARLQSMLAR